MEKSTFYKKIIVLCCFVIVSFNDIKMIKLEYFKYEEFDSPDKRGSGKNMHPETLRKLEKAREFAGFPFVISSGYRTKQHNNSLIERGYKASKQSTHLEGRAVDIIVKDSVHRLKLLEALQFAGFRRFGVSKGFIHTDDSEHKPECLWTY